MGQDLRLSQVPLSCPLAQGGLVSPDGLGERGYTVICTTQWLEPSDIAVFCIQ